MPDINWLADHWFDLLQTIGILGGFMFTSESIRRDVRARRTENLLRITKQHFQIWSLVIREPKLKRVLATDVNLVENPVTMDEEIFVGAVILHLNASYRASKHDMFIAFERLDLDIHGFFSLPIPAAVWKSTKATQDTEFAVFVDRCLRAQAH